MASTARYFRIFFALVRFGLSRELAHNQQQQQKGEQPVGAHLRTLVLSSLPPGRLPAAEVADVQLRGMSNASDGEVPGDLVGVRAHLLAHGPREADLGMMLDVEERVQLWPWDRRALRSPDLRAALLGGVGASVRLSDRVKSARSSPMARRVRRVNEPDKHAINNP